jgi:cytochrome c oxidase accessory protein FixG
VSRGAIRSDGARVAIHAARVSGRFARARAIAFVGLIAIYVLLPWIRLGGHPAVFLDIDARRFYLFGADFDAGDVWMMTFLLLGAAFALVYVTALLGRIWCGWACPQTVFLDGVYRRLERWIGGKKPGGPRLVLLHVAYALVSIVIAHVFLAYFVSIPALLAMMRRAPSAHLDAFVAVTAVSALLYANFAWFREQLCIVVCPYGRLQSVLLDADSLVVGYDAGRGEPRGKLNVIGNGDCIDCRRCVAVCPNGIDIRDGYQLDCIACTACIDACDEMMDKVGRKRGLVRYDSQNGLAGKKRRIVRPRMWAYTALLGVFAIVAAFALRTRTDFDAALLRVPGQPYVVDESGIRNAYLIHLANKRSVRTTFAIAPEPTEGMRFVVPLTEVTLEPLGQAEAPVFATLDPARYASSFALKVHMKTSGEERVLTAPFVGPTR